MLIVVVMVVVVMMVIVVVVVVVLVVMTVVVKVVVVVVVVLMVMTVVVIMMVVLMLMTVVIGCDHGSIGSDDGDSNHCADDANAADALTPQLPPTPVLTSNLYRAGRHQPEASSARTNRRHFQPHKQGAAR